jgi:hypothetical protein
MPPAKLGLLSVLTSLVDRESSADLGEIVVD